MTTRDTLGGIIQQLDPGLVTLAHSGAKAYREAFDLLYRREAERPNELWQADQCMGTDDTRGAWIGIGIDEARRPRRDSEKSHKREIRSLIKRRTRRIGRRVRKRRVHAGHVRAG